MAKSYHDLQKTTEEDVLTYQLTRIFGRPYWMQMMTMIRELCKIACKFKVSYNWSGNYGLMAMILGAAKYAARYPALPAYVQPTLPGQANIPPGNPSNEVVRNAIHERDIQVRDWAVVCGFVAGAGKLIRNALDYAYYSALDHAETGFIDVFPIQYLNHLATEWCPLDHTAITQVENHFKRGWNHAGGERINKFAERLDQEQTLFDRDGVTIDDAVKFRHYMAEIYKSGAFSHEKIKEWVSRATNLQTYAKARTFSEEDTKASEDVLRLTNTTAGGHGFGAAMSVQELEELGSNLRPIIVDAVNGSLKEAVIAAVAAEISKQAPTAAKVVDQANAIRDLKNENTTLKGKLDDLTAVLNALRNDVRNLAANGGGSGTSSPATGNGSDGSSGGSSTNNQHETFGVWDKSARSRVEGKDYEALPKDWPRKKKTWWWTEFRKRCPAEYKTYEKARLQRQLNALSK